MPLNRAFVDKPTKDTTPSSSQISDLLDIDGLQDITLTISLYIKIPKKIIVFGYSPILSRILTSEMQRAE